MDLDRQSCYRAVRSRDRRFDGRFFTGVLTTGIYCRPICPAPVPKLENVRFFACAAAAEEAGLRPCRRCRPEAAPGTPAWLGTSVTVSRALRLIDEGALDEGGIEALAARLGVGARHLRRLFVRHIGAAPLAVALTRRIHFARSLIEETRLPFTRIAMHAGFQSVRQFHHSIRHSFHRSPREPRGSARPMLASARDVRLASARDVRLASARDVRLAPARDIRPRLSLELPFRAPYDWRGILAFLGARAIPGVEIVSGGRYRRSIEIDGILGTIAVARAKDKDALVVEVAGDVELLAVARRVTRLFDLDADSASIVRHLKSDPKLAPSLRRGLRVPGAWDGFELAVRAVLGQQVSVAAARTLASRLVRAFGRPLGESGDQALTHAFPRPEALAGADLRTIGVTRARADTLRALAEAVAGGRLRFGLSQSLEHFVEEMTRLPGIGPWTAQYVAMRALGEPDAFPLGDLGLRRSLGNGAGPASEAVLAAASEAWRPWRAYAAIALWSSGAPRGERK